MEENTTNDVTNEVNYRINELIAKTNSLRAPLAELYTKAKKLEGALYDKLRIFEPYLYDMKIMTDRKKYYTGGFNGEFKPISFFYNSDLNGEETKQIEADMELLLKIYNSYGLNLEQFVFGLEHIIKEVDFIRSYYFALQLSTAHRRQEKNLEKLNLAFIPRLNGLNNQLEVKQEQFLEAAVKFWFVGSAVRTSTALCKRPGEFFQEDHVCLMRDLVVLNDTLTSALSCRMIPAEKPQLVRQKDELFKDDDMLKYCKWLGGR